MSNNAHSPWVRGAGLLAIGGVILVGLGLESVSSGLGTIVVAAGLLGIVVWAAWPELREPALIEAHRCHQCGYSRSGIPDTSPCPECGTEPLP